MRPISTERLDPAKAIIEKVGGAHTVAQITGRSVTRVYRWMYPSNRGGTGGLIPHREARKLLEYAAENKIDLKAGEFFGEAA